MAQPMNIAIRNRRLENEEKKLNKEPLHYATAYRDKDDPLIWYFLMVGQKGTDYYGGEYIGKILHSPKYPIEAPDYVLLTPSGRYETNRKICLSNSGFHKSEWSSTWNIISILAAFYSIWIDDREIGLGHIKDTPANRRRMAMDSINFNMRNFPEIYEKFNRTHLRNDDMPNTTTPEPDKSPEPSTGIMNTITNTLANVSNFGIDTTKTHEGQKADINITDNTDITDIKQFDNINNDIVVPDELKEIVNEQVDIIEPEFEPIKTTRKYKSKKNDATVVKGVTESKPKTTRKKKNENN